jgi:hypothetical protein
LLRLIESTQFDTVYHEHFSYFSLHTVAKIFASVGLAVHDVEELPTHGGSLRVYGSPAAAGRRVEPAVARVLEAEEAFGLRDPALYDAFQARAEKVKDGALSFLLDCRRDATPIAAYGAAAKGNTLLNFAGVKPDLLPYVCDAAASKQGRFLPGSHIPVLAPGALRSRKPRIIVILPWNIAAEVASELAYAREWGARFATLTPTVRLL